MAAALAGPPAPDTSTSEISLIGLGAMGTALGRALLAAGHRPTVWNRTTARAAPLVEAGAVLADDALHAVTAAPVTLFCLRDGAAVDALLRPLPAAGLRGRTLINLTSSTPQQARDLARLADERGARYLDGAIMVPTPMIGDAEAMLIFSGDRELLQDNRGLLTALAGRLEWVGTDPALAAVYDLGMLDLYLTGMAGFLHAAALVEAEGVPVTEFLPYATSITDVLRETLPGLAKDVAARSYPGDEDTTRMELAITDHVVETSRARSLDTSVPQLVRSLLQHAIDTGHGEHGFSSIYEQLAPAGAGTVSTSGPDR